MPALDTVLALPARLSAKADPALVAADEEHLARVRSTLDRQVSDLRTRLDVVRRWPGGHGQAALDRDQEVHRLTARLRTLTRFGADLCLGHVVEAATGQRLYVGRLGLTDDDGRRLLVDWRSPAAEPFFAATHARPLGLASRRRYRWTGGHVTDYWDEVFVDAEVEGHRASLDDQSAFVASLGASRSPRMRDVLATIQADQDAIIRASSRGALVVDGGPGTGKTVVALHRTAYLLYADPRLGEGRGGVLFVGPHRPYLAYVGDVLPSLGEDGVRTCTIRDLVPEGATAGAEADPVVAALKASAAMVDAVEAAARLYEEPPTEGLEVETPWADVWCSRADWAEAFGAADPATPHNEARDEVWDELVAILAAKVLDAGGIDEEVSDNALRRALRAHPGLTDALTRAWPLLEPADLVGDLWDVPAYLRHCAPWLAPDDVRRLQRDDPHAWTVSDLPLLDAAHRRLGDPAASRRRRRQRAEVERQRAEMADVVGHLIATDDSELKVMSMLRVSDAQSVIVDEEAVTEAADAAGYAGLAGPFAHVVVDEAQELTDAEWRVLLDRCPSRSLTIVGDRAQARAGFAESWTERLARVGLARVELAGLTVNYRTPAEVMAAAEPVIRAVLPDANVPTSVRSTGVGVDERPVADLEVVVGDWLAAHDEGTACVVATAEVATRLPATIPATVAGSPRVRVLTPVLAKGLEFDLVVLVDPASYGGGVTGAVDRYVAMTRATQRLVVLT